MAVPEDHITVSHGSLIVNVPRNLFRGPKAELVSDKAEPFRDMLRKRYPWLSENSVDVFMRRAREEMIRVIDEETNGRTISKEMASEGNVDDAIKHLKAHLSERPDDADSWYLLGELLCKNGKTEEGYKAMNKGRSLIEK